MMSFWDLFDHYVTDLDMVASVERTEREVERSEREVKMHIAAILSEEDDDDEVNDPPTVLNFEETVDKMREELDLRWRLHSEMYSGQPMDPLDWHYMLRELDQLLNDHEVLKALEEALESYKEEQQQQHQIN